ncbi:DUF3889 domain-containing protein [Paenibacillus whitsoniae]|nr:DUF3889 domain-containing protein [Paenibacillus whitsoniae]
MPLSMILIMVAIQAFDASGTAKTSPQTAALQAPVFGFISQSPPPAPTLDPGYAKWSRIAFQEAGKVYTLLDYKYLGKTDVAPGVAQQQFRFWARHQGKEFPLIVTIRYDPVSERIFAILMEQQNLRGSLRML